MSGFETEFLQVGSVVSIDSHRVLVGWGERKWSENYSDSAVNPQFYFPDFFLTIKQPWFSHNTWAVMSIDQLISLFPPSHFPCASLESPWQSNHYEFFKEEFYLLKNQIASGVLNKAVPYIFQTNDAQMTTSRLQNSLSKGLEACRTHPLYLYGFWDEKGGILGVTPEILFNRDQKKSTLIHTAAVAGTQKRGASKEAFLKDPKLEQEHALVVEGISDALRAFGTVKHAFRRIVEFSFLEHLVTPIELELAGDFQFELLVKALHPTPALGAYPYFEGKKWLKTYDNYMQRGRYGSPIGYVDGFKAGCYVAIRNVQWTPLGMAIAAGCGVVDGSQLDEEWEEIELKIRAIKGTLDL